MYECLKNKIERDKLLGYKDVSTVFHPLSDIKFPKSNKKYRHESSTSGKEESSSNITLVYNQKKKRGFLSDK